jgi:hypothetical protein
VGGGEANSFASLKRERGCISRPVVQVRDPCLLWVSAGPWRMSMDAPPELSPATPLDVSGSSLPAGIGAERARRAALALEEISVALRELSGQLWRWRRSPWR